MIMIIYVNNPRIHESVFILKSSLLRYLLLLLLLILICKLTNLISPSKWVLISKVMVNGMQSNNNFIKIKAKGRDYSTSSYSLIGILEITY